MRLDSNVVHADDVGGIVGEFYGTDIHEVNMLAVDLRQELVSQSAARMSLGEEPTRVELLPGETIKGGLIRRFTAAEVRGDEFYEKDIPEGLQVPIKAGDSFSRNNSLITWRPNNEEFAVIHEEGE